MLFEHAQFEDKSISVEAGLAALLIRMESGRFKVRRIKGILADAG
jgi:hypothetical protein